MSENKYAELIEQVKTALEGLDKDKWESLAEKATEDKGFKHEIQTTTMVDNLPIVLRHLLPEVQIDPSQTVDIAFALGSDKTIDQSLMRPFGSLLIGNLARMRELLPEPKK